MSFEVLINHQQASPVILLKDNDTGCEAEIYSFGGLLNALTIPVQDYRVNVVDGFSSVSDAMKNITQGFKSAKLSPFVCRMFTGKYQLNQQEYQVNKHWLNGHAIHGLVYDGIYSLENTATTSTAASVTLTYQYTGSDMGYPFPYLITLIWKLEKLNRLTVATTIIHHNQQPIPLADGWHPYFTLGNSIDECTLQFDSTELLLYDAGLLPTGKKMSDTRFINGSLLKGIQLDNSFNLNDSGKCVLRNHLLKLIVEPDKNYRVLQIYTPDHRRSIAIENLSGAPDNFNNGMGLIFLPPGKPITFTTSYTVTEN